MPTSVEATPSLAHARRILPDRGGAGSCTTGASSRHRRSAVGGGSRSHRGGRGRITDRRGPHQGPADGNLPKPGARPDRRFCHAQHLSSRVHSPPLVRSRTGANRRVTRWRHPLLHILARRFFPRSFQRLPPPQQRLCYPDGCGVTPRPGPHDALVVGAPAGARAWPGPKTTSTWTSMLSYIFSTPSILLRPLMP